MEGKSWQTSAQLFLAAVGELFSLRYNRFTKMNLETLQTPALVLDVERVLRNAERMRRHVGEMGSRLRPHVKTHKCVEIARIQTADHAGTITVSTLAEACGFAAKGFQNITYAVPIEESLKLRSSWQKFVSN